MKRAALILLMILAVGAAGVWLGKRIASTPPGSLAIPERPAKISAAVSYACPMHPHIVQDHPGACPICGMELVVLKDVQGAATRQIFVDTATRQKLGVQLARAETATLTHDIPAFGTLVPDESAVMRLTANMDGMLMKLHVNRPGQRIAPGQLLFEISSPEALGLQYEYLDIQGRGASAYRMADERRAQNRRAMEETADAKTREQAERNAQQSEEQLASILRPLERDRERIGLRLMQMGFTDAMLDTLAKDRQVMKEVPVRAPRACVVKEVLARPGMTVGHMTEILHCIDPARSQIEIVLYADQLSWVEEGNALTIAFAGGETLQTKLTGLHPLVDEATRTLKVRVPLAMQRPANFGEYARVTLHATPRQVLSVPKTAVMRSGRGDFVMQSLGNGHFMPVKVVTGIETAERVAIRAGLEAGDEVAVNGQFLLDAAASIADTAQRMRAARTPAP
jgi:Cu(I)/Ag(I) efflux system membrane fusion protein